MASPNVYLVTGGAGFIGSHISEMLLRRRCRVRIFDNMSSGQEQNIRALRKIGCGYLEVMIGDLRDRRAVRRAARGARFILHQGALPSVARSLTDPLTTHDVNVNGTLNLLEASREVRVERFVFASSSSVYGNSGRLPKVERQRENPVSPYAVSKVMAEMYCKLFHSLYGVKTVILRYFNVFGPRQDPESEYAAVIPRFMMALLRNQRPIIYGDGRQSRDFTFVSDVVRANLKALRSPIRSCGMAYNIAAGRRTSLVELLRVLSRVTGKTYEPRFEPERVGDVRHSTAALGRAQRILRYKPRVGLEKGLRLTLQALPGGR